MVSVFTGEDSGTVEENDSLVGYITEKDKFHAAKQILLGLAILYILTLGASIIHPEESERLLEICKTIFPPLVTLILAEYFHYRRV